MIKVVLCDDQSYVREGLQIVLDNDPEISVIGTASTGVDAIEKISYLKPTVALIDLMLPDMDGIEIVKQVRAKRVDVAILMLTSHKSREKLIEAIRSGVSGYILKDTQNEELLFAVKQIASGNSYFSPKMSNFLVNFVRHNQTASKKEEILSRLSIRERQVLWMVGKQFSNAEIAKKLSLSKGTVQNYVSSMMHNIDVKYRSEAAQVATESGLTDSELPKY